MREVRRRRRKRSRTKEVRRSWRNRMMRIREVADL